MFIKGDRMKQITMGLLVSTVMIFTACGGGSSSSSSSSTSISFPSDSVLAEPTLVNALKVTEVAVGDPLDNLPDVPLLNSVDNSSKVNMELLSRNVSQKIAKDAKNNIETYSLNAVDEFTEACLVSGTIDFYANGDEISGGYVTITYNDCNDGDDTLLNGSVYMTVSNLDSTTGEFKDMTIKFTTDFTLTDLSQTLIAKIVKDSYISMNILAFDMYGEPTDFRLSMSIQATDGIEIFGIENAVYDYETSGTIVVVSQTQGNIYIDNLAAYVEFDTSVQPFYYDNGSLISGEIIYNMADGGKMKIVINNGLVITYVDADGDGDYEISDLPSMPV